MRRRRRRRQLPLDLILEETVVVADKCLAKPALATFTRILSLADENGHWTNL